MKKLLSALGVILILLAFQDSRNENKYVFDLKLSTSVSTQNTRMVPGNTFGKKVLQVDTKEAVAPSGIKNDVTISGSIFDLLCAQANELVLTNGTEEIRWDKANYLIIEVWHENAFDVTMNVLFYEKGRRKAAVVHDIQKYIPDSLRMICSVGILPFLKTQMIIPLNSLSGQNIFISRQPRQMKGTSFGFGINKNKIGKISLLVMPAQGPDFLPKVQIASVRIMENLPEPYPILEQTVVDSFGQWTRRDWAGKIKNEVGLKKAILAIESQAEKAQLPEEWNRNGAWEKKQFKTTGFFHTHYDGKRWWLVDPEGLAFLSTGVDCINGEVRTVVSGQQDLFEWLPATDDPIYRNSYKSKFGEFNFLRANLMRVYGANWSEKWQKINTGLLKKWNVNTIGNWSDKEFVRKALLPYVITLADYPSTGTKIYRDFPDVFSPEYKQKAIQYARQLATIKNDTLLIGYFLQNEPQWAFGANNLALEMFRSNMPFDSKKEFIKWLEAKYGDVNALNLVWKLELKSYKEMEILTLMEPPSKKAWDDLWIFSGIMVERYVEIVCREVKKVDNNHLNLGMRYNHISSDLCYKGGQYFDVFSINGYTNPGPPPTEEISRRTGRPVMIGEWHFGCAREGGLPASGLQATESQKERAMAFRYYLEQGFARPEVVGIHWFQMNDQAVTGRFDGENYNIGFLDVCMQPYPELTKAVSLSNSRIYRVATGEMQPFDKKIRKVPVIDY